VQIRPTFEKIPVYVLLLFLLLLLSLLLIGSSGGYLLGSLAPWPSDPPREEAVLLDPREGRLGFEITSRSFSKLPISSDLL
jgi:hypothetical protein